MRLKTFQAKSMGDAMRQVKEALGDDAIIVSSKEEKGGWVRITAAVEQVAPEPEPIPARGATAAFDEDTVIEMIADTLLKHRVPGQVSDAVISAASIVVDGDPRATLARALEKTFTFAPLQAKKPKPVVLVGPPGAGKTLMTAKLAAEAVLNGNRPAVITTDITRAGGVEQLEAFLDILALPLHQAGDAKALAAVLKQSGGASSAIIDTGGLNPFDPQEMKTLAKLLAVGDMDAALVLPAGTDAEESAEIALTFEILGVRKFIPTRLDFARRMGGILSAANKAGLSFTSGSHTPSVANGIMHMTPESLAALLMPHVPQPEKPKRGRKS